MTKNYDIYKRMAICVSLCISFSLQQLVVRIRLNSIMNLENRFIYEIS